MPAVQYILHHEPAITFSPGENRLTLGEDNIHLEPLQAKLLEFLIEQQGEVISIRTIADNVWDRKQVSDNLVRQVVSLLRGQLQDKARPYRIIKTIPKKGYLFDLEVTKQQPCPEPQPEPAVELVPKMADVLPEPVQEAPAVESAPPNLPFSKGVLFVLLAILIAASIYAGIHFSANRSHLEHDSQSTISAPLTGTIPVYLHEVALDDTADYQIAQSIYNYIFYGLNSSQAITSYNYSHLNEKAQNVVHTSGYEIKSWIKQVDSKFRLTVYLQSTQAPALNTKIEEEFDQSNFFEVIGDVVLELKTVIAPSQPDYEVDDHLVTAVENYDDWQIISSGISMFYQGRGSEQMKHIAEKLDIMKQQGRDSYLVDGLLSYVSSLNYLQNGSEQEKENALTLAQEAFNKDPRCDIANVTLGLALLLNNRGDQSYPYLFYASKSAPSPLSFYLLSIIDGLAQNPRGSSHYHRLFTEMQKEKTGEFYDLMERLQKTNILQTRDFHKI